MTTTLATLADFKSHLLMDPSDVTLDSKLQGFLNAATQVVENITGPIVQRTSVTEVHSGGNGGRTQIVLRQRPATSLISVTEYVGNTPTALTIASSPSAATSASVTFDAETGTVTRRVGSGREYEFAWGVDNVVVNYVAGFATVPDNIRLAALFQAAHLYQSSQLGGRPSWAGAGAPDDSYPMPGMATSYAIPNRVRELLEPHERVPGFA